MQDMLKTKYQYQCLSSHEAGRMDEYKFAYKTQLHLHTKESRFQEDSSKDSSGRNIVTGEVNRQTRNLAPKIPEVTLNHVYLLDLRLQKIEKTQPQKREKQLC